MPYCSQCGALVGDDARFCTQCGRAIASTVAAQPAAPATTPQPAPAPAAPQTNYAQPAPGFTTDFSAVTVRYRCPNGHAFDGGENITVCPSCGAPLPDGGYIQMYRKGNYMGCAVGMGIYIDGVPYGHIGNRQSLRIKVPFGPHKIHVTHTTTRKCNDPIFNVTPQEPHIFCKAHFSSAGFTIKVEQAMAKDMPRS